MKRIAIISDVHANWEALQAVLNHAQTQKVDDCWFLGDALGYGPDPNKCSDRLQQLVSPENWVAGNHDRGVTGQLTYGYFPNHDPRQKSSAWQVIERHQGLFQDEEEREFLGFLSQLPSYRQPVNDSSPVADVWLVHGRVSQNDNREHEEIDNLTGDTSYIFRYDKDTAYAEKSWQVLAQRQDTTPHLILAGHTHHPMLWRRDPRHFSATAPWGPVSADQARLASQAVIDLGDTPVWINPGSVGQPRDGDLRAAYAILDLGENQITFHRLAYNLKATQRKMREQGYPERFILRLENGT